MHTGTLLRRRTALLKCEESFAVSDRYGYELPPNPDETGYVEFKDQPQWRYAYEDVKEVLATREHIPTGQEKKSKRIKQQSTRKQ